MANALLSFGYALLLKDVMNAILTFGLEPALGFDHQPRSQACPLTLDLILQASLFVKPNSRLKGAEPRMMPVFQPV